MYSDGMFLLPEDNGYAVIDAEDNEHLIIDSRSDLPSWLFTSDGTKEKAVIADQGSVSPFTIDPRKNPMEAASGSGSNYACLLVWTDENGNQPCQFLADITMKYRPRYLLVP